MKYIFLLVFYMNSLFASDLSVLVVGAGPSGLAVTKALQNSGIYPDIIEKEAVIRADGAGIALPANGSWALEKLGIPVAKHAQKIEKMQFTDELGNLLIEETISSIHPDGAQFYSISRDGLQKMLLTSLDSRTKISTKKEVVRFYEENEKVHVLFSDGESKSYDFVIACDGIRSSLRQKVHSDEKPEYLGLLVWRALLEARVALEGPVYMLGSDRTALLYPLPNNQIYLYGQLYQAKAESPASSFKDLFASFGGHMPNALEKVESTDFYIHHMEKSASVRFTLDGFCRILLIGDAAHAFGPMLQNGAAQAFEDAYVLQELVKTCRSGKEIPELVDAFTKRRTARVEQIYTSSNAKIQAISDPKLLETRNQMIRTSGAPNVNAFKLFMKQNP